MYKSLEDEAFDTLDENNKSIEALVACITCDHQLECDRLFDEKVEVTIDRIKSCPVLKHILNS